VLFFLTAGCGIIYFHNPQKARGQADEFINLIYVKKQYDAAYSMTDKFFKDNFGRDKLVNTAEFFLKKYGKFEGARADSYFTEGGSRDITVFYTAVSEGGETYQKITLNDDKKNGYLISSIEVSDIPFKGYRLIKKFKEE
jgi:hypothetical protein